MTTNIIKRHIMVWLTECLNARFQSSLCYLAICGIQREVKKPKIGDISLKKPVKCESDSPVQISGQNCKSTRNTNFSYKSFQTLIYGHMNFIYMHVCTCSHILWNELQIYVCNDYFLWKIYKCLLFLLFPL